MTIDPGDQEPVQLGPRDALDVLLQQYTSVRGQGDQALSGQLAALSLGLAALAVLIAALANVWRSAPLIASVGFMVAVPGVAYFLLLVWATELKKTIRASSFLRRVVEPRINAFFSDSQALLTWESEGYAYGRIVPYYLAIAASITAFAWVSYAFGAVHFERLASRRHGWLWSDTWPTLFGVAVVLIPAILICYYIVTEAKTNIRERGGASTGDA